MTESSKQFATHCEAVEIAKRIYKAKGWHLPLLALPTSCEWNMCLAAVRAGIEASAKACEAQQCNEALSGKTKHDAAHCMRVMCASAVLGLK